MKPNPPQGRSLLLIDFEDTSRFYNRGSLLAFGKALGAHTIDIDSRELFAVVIIDSHLPVAVLAAPIFLNARSLLCLGLLHVGESLEKAGGCSHPNIAFYCRGASNNLRVNP
jgi:hypothetical protein